MSEPISYAAFVSYAHRDPDTAVASWLQKSIETFPVPRALVRSRGLPKRPGRVFVDRTELSVSPSLREELDRRLRSSSYLIVLCSPRSARSEWVDHEVATFCELNGRERVVSVLVEGEIEEVAPPSLYARDSADAPLAADLRGFRGSRASARRSALLAIVAQLLEVEFDDLAARDAARRRKVRAITVLVGAAVALAIGALLWMLARTTERETESQRNKTARVLARAAISEQADGNHELAVLLALHAKRLDDEVGGGAADAVADALRATMETHVPSVRARLPEGLGAFSGSLSPDGSEALIAASEAGSEATVLRWDLTDADAPLEVVADDVSLGPVGHCGNGRFTLRPGAAGRLVVTDRSGGAREVAVGPALGSGELAWQRHGSLVVWVGEGERVMAVDLASDAGPIALPGTVAVGSKKPKARLAVTEAGQVILQIEESPPLVWDATQPAAWAFPAGAPTVGDRESLSPPSVDEARQRLVAPIHRSDGRRGGAFVWTLPLSPDAPAQRLPPHDEGVATFLSGIAPDGQWTATSAALEPTLRLGVIGAAEIEERPLAGHEKVVTSIAFDGSGTRLLTCGTDARLWDLRATRLTHSIPMTEASGGPLNLDTDQGSRVPDSVVRSLLDMSVKVRFTPDGTVVLAHSTTQPGATGIAFLSPDHPERGRRRAHGPEGVLPSLGEMTELVRPTAEVALSPDGQVLLAAARRGGVLAWRTDDLTVPISLPDGPDPATSVDVVALDSDGTLRIAAGGVAGDVVVWDLVNGRGPRRALRDVGSSAVRALCLSRDGTFVALACGDGAIELLDADDEETQVLGRHDAAATDVTFSADGERVYSVSEDGTMRAWNVDGGAHDVLLHREGETLRTVVVVPPGDYVAAGSAAPSGMKREGPEGLEQRGAAHGSLYLVDLRAGRARGVVIRHKIEAGVASLDVDREGRWLAIGTEQMSVMFALATSERLEEAARAFVTRDLTEEEWVRFVGDALPYPGSVLTNR